MEEGLLTGFDGVIFITREEEYVHLSSVCRDQFHLIKDSVPNVVRLAANKIFNTGKGVAFLRRLGWEKHRLRQDPTKEVAMTYEICLSTIESWLRYSFR